MPARVLHRFCDFVMLMRGRELDADAGTYFGKDRARSANEILRDLIVPPCLMGRGSMDPLGTCARGGRSKSALPFEVLSFAETLAENRQHGSHR
jgi:hypothetical protein